MDDFATKILETPAERRSKLVAALSDDLIKRGYNFFDFDASPRDTPDLSLNKGGFEFARTIRRLPNSGFLWRNANYSVSIAGKFILADPYNIIADIKGKDEFGVIERMLSGFNARHRFDPETKFYIKGYSPDYQIWTTEDYRKIMAEGRRVLRS